MVPTSYWDWYHLHFFSLRSPLTCTCNDHYTLDYEIMQAVRCCQTLESADCGSGLLVVSLTKRTCQVLMTLDAQGFVGLTSLSFWCCHFTGILEASFSLSILSNNFLSPPLHIAWWAHMHPWKGLLFVLLNIDCVKDSDRREHEMDKTKKPPPPYGRA